MYIEYVLIENFIMNFFIISCTQKILREKAKLYLIGIFMATVIAVLCPLFNLNILTSTIIKISSSILICTLSFKLENLKKAILTYVLFLGVTFLFGGACEFLKQVLGEVTILSTLLFSFATYIIFKNVIRKLNKKKIVDNFSTEVEIINGDKKVVEKGYFDSGNLLYDPITSKPISLISQSVFEKLYGDNVNSILLKKFDEKKLKNGHYIEVNSAVKGGKMLIFDVDELVILSSKQKKSYKNISLGLSFSGFEKAMNSQVLLHSSSAFN